MIPDIWIGSLNVFQTFILYWDKLLKKTELYETRLRLRKTGFLLHEIVAEPPNHEENIELARTNQLKLASEAQVGISDDISWS